MSTKIEPIAFGAISPSATITIEEMSWGETYFADGRPIQCQIEWERACASLLEKRMTMQTTRGGAQ